MRTYVRLFTIKEARFFGIHLAAYASLRGGRILPARLLNGVKILADVPSVSILNLAFIVASSL